MLQYSARNAYKRDIEDKCIPDSFIIALILNLKKRLTEVKGNTSSTFKWMSTWRMDVHFMYVHSQFSLNIKKGKVLLPVKVILRVFLYSFLYIFK